MNNIVTNSSAFRLPPSAFAASLNLFCGDANPAEARVYARLELSDQTLPGFIPEPSPFGRGQGEGAGLSADTLTPTLSQRERECDYKLSGRLIGPQCEFAHTLSARIPFVDRIGEQSLLAEAIVPDPCFWTPELPFLYRALLELRHGDSLIASCERSVGLRRLGVRGRSLHFDGQRFVLRGIETQMGNGEWGVGSEADFARESWTVLVSSLPDDQICEFASRRGMLLVADLTALDFAGDAEAIAAQLRRLAQWPAVAVAMIRGDQKLNINVHEDARNLLLAAYVSIDEPLSLASWMDLAFIEVGEPADFARKISECSVPVIAVRRLLSSTSIENSRSACDQLQSDLASIGDFAGYVV